MNGGDLSFIATERIEAGAETIRQQSSDDFFLQHMDRALDYQRTAMQSLRAGTFALNRSTATFKNPKCEAQYLSYVFVASKALFTTYFMCTWRCK